VGLSISSERFLEAILAEKQVALVDVQPRNAEPIAMPGEDATGFLGRCKGAVVAAQVGKRLNGAVQRTRDIPFLTQASKQLQRGVVALERLGPAAAW